MYLGMDHVSIFEALTEMPSLQSQATIAHMKIYNKLEKNILSIDSRLISGS